MNRENYQTKFDLLEKANKILGLSKIKEEKVIFVYCPPRVGSTSLVSTLRLSGGHIYKVLHIHDEQMLKYVGNIHDVTVNDIIDYNSYLGRKVFVIDIYREPLERKMSEFFGKLSSYHFNADVQTLENYQIDRIIKRFDNLFPHIGIEDHFTEKYKIHKKFDLSMGFNDKKKFLSVERDNIHFIKIRLRDFDKWKEILEPILGIEITIIKDNARDNLQLSNLYKKFKEEYKIPLNFIQSISESESFKLYLSSHEREEYLKTLFPEMRDYYNPFTIREYNAYTEISSENQQKVDIETDHYFDEGCQCEYCCKMRRITIARLKIKLPPLCKILHRICYQKVNLDAPETFGAPKEEIPKKQSHPDPNVNKMTNLVKNAVTEKKDLINSSTNKRTNHVEVVSSSPITPPPHSVIQNKNTYHPEFEQPPPIPRQYFPSSTLSLKERISASPLGAQKNYTNQVDSRRIYKREDGTFVTFVRNTLTKQIVMKEVEKPE